MSYKPLNGAISYLSNLYVRMGEIAVNSLFPPSGLEFAVAGVPSRNMKELATPKGDSLRGSTNETTIKPTVYFMLSNISSYFGNGKGQLSVRRTDGRTVTLHAASAKHSPEDYVKKVLGDNGMRPPTAEIKKIAKALINKNQ